MEQLGTGQLSLNGAAAARPQSVSSPAASPESAQGPSQQNDSQSTSAHIEASQSKLQTAQQTAQPIPEWVRLQKALSVDSDRGFNNIEGHHQLFNEFLSESLQNGLKTLSQNLSGQISPDKWRTLSERFNRYADLSFSQRQHLVADTRRFLHRARQAADAQPLLAESGGTYLDGKSKTRESKSTAKKADSSTKNSKASRKRSPKTTDVTGLVNRPNSNHPWISH